MRPSVGSVMRDRILSSVLLPAPLRPMMPSLSPACTSKVTSRSAHIVSVCPPVDVPAPFSLLKGAAADFTTTSRSVGYRSLTITDLVLLAEPFDLDDHVGHRHTTSAKLRSMRLK